MALTTPEPQPVATAPDRPDEGQFVPSPQYRRYMEHFESANRDAKEGKLQLVPEGLWISITENCNFKCVGCYMEGLFKKTYLSVDELKLMLDGNDAKFDYISLTEGEAFLHPTLCEIIEYCKEHHPEAKVDLVTNGSVAIRGKYRRAISLIDSLGVSIDGARKETYESIRRGGNFERFLANVREIVAVQKETGSPAAIEFSFTAMTTNIGELPDVVRIAADVGIKNVYVQPMEMRDQEIIDRVGPYHIDNMPIEDVYRITDEARQVGRTLGVAFYGAQSLMRPRRKAPEPQAVAAEPDLVRDGAASEMAIRMCQYFWHKPFQYVREGSRFQVLPCCYMLKSDAAKVASRYGLDFERPRSTVEVYNSDAYWQMRRDLVEGKLNDLCGGCRQAQTFPWKEKA